MILTIAGLLNISLSGNLVSGYALNAEGVQQPVLPAILQDSVSGKFISLSSAGKMIM